MSRQRKLSQLFSSFHFPHVKVSVFVSYDILYSAPLPLYDFLINPANEALCGTRQSYFPVGGPVPMLPSSTPSKSNRLGKETIKHHWSQSKTSSRWGGMDAGQNMMYPVQVLDGCVHAECGPQLLEHLQMLPDQSPFIDAAGQNIKCPVGTAVVSPAFGALSPYFKSIIHTVSPFQSDSNCYKLLLSCYLSSFRLAWKSSVVADTAKNIVPIPTTIATTLLGAGCRGISVEDASRVAAAACITFSGDLEQWRARDEENGRCDVNKDPSMGGDMVKKKKENVDDLEIHFILREEVDCQLLTDYLKKETTTV